MQRFSVRSLFLLPVAAFVISGCGGGDSKTQEVQGECVPGQVRSCTCDDGRTGGQVCDDDGQAYGECSCVELRDAGPGSDGGESDVHTPPLDGGGDADVVESVLNLKSVSPPDGASGVAVDRTLLVVFDKPLDPKSVNSQTLPVRDAKGPVVGKYVVDRQMVSFIPALLLPTHHYTVEITPGVRAMDGSHVAKDVVNKFVTGKKLQSGNTAPESMRTDVLPPRFVRLTRQVELIATGKDGLSDSSVKFMDLHGGNDPKTIGYKDLDIGWRNGKPFSLGNVRKLHAAALDKDFREDFVAIVGEAKGPAALYAFATTGALVSAKFDRTTVLDKLEIPSQGSDKEYDYQLGVADLDRDGFDEIIVSALAGGRARIFVFDDAVHAYKRLSVIDLPNIQTIKELVLTTGQFDQDQNEEFVIGFRNNSNTKVFLQGYEMEAGKVVKALDVSLKKDYSLKGFWNTDSGLQLVSAQMDGDKPDEIMIVQAGYWADVINLRHFEISTRGVVDLTDWHKGTVQEGELIQRKDSISADFPNDTSYCGESPEAHLADIDGNGKPDLVLGPLVFLHPMNKDDTPRKSDKLIPHRTIVADVDGDGRDDVLSFGNCHVLYKRRLREFRVLSYHETKHYDPSTGEKLDSQFAWQEQTLWKPADIDDTMSDAFVVADIDLDQDSTVLEAPLDDDGNAITDDTHTEQRVTVRQIFKDNVVLAVLAAPPCSEEYGQDLSNCSTGFGTKTSGSITVGGSVSVYAYALAGVDIEVQAGAGLVAAATETVLKAQSLVKFGLEQSVYSSMTATSSLTITNYAGADEDLVIFYTIPYNHYEYKTVSVSSREPGREKVIGKPFVMEIPLGPRVMAVSREYYNRTNGDQWDIGKNVMPNEPGKIESYPKLSQVPDLMKGFVPVVPPTVPLTVSEGSGSTEINQEFEVSSTVGTSLTITLEQESLICAGGVCGGFGLGNTFGFYAETSFGTGTVVSGSVAAIPADKYPTHMFQFGMFAYLRSAPVGRVTAPFLLVDYYVEK